MSASVARPGSRAAWDVIEEVCVSRFTGELVLRTSTRTTHVFMTRGLIYFAEHEGSEPLGRRLTVAGGIPGELIDAAGPGALDDLDALFAGQDPSEHSLAEGIIQADTERALLEIAEEPVLAQESTMYRHHRSGIDRWFSSQYARGTVEGSCGTEIADDGGPPVAAAEPPSLIPPMQPDLPPTDVEDALQRALSATESATKTIGPAPKGFVRTRRRGD